MGNDRLGVGFGAVSETRLLKLRIRARLTRVATKLASTADKLMLELRCSSHLIIVRSLALRKLQPRSLVLQGGQDVKMRCDLSHHKNNLINAHVSCPLRQ